MSLFGQFQDPDVRTPFYNPTVQLLFVTRMVRLFAYGFLALILWLYLAALGLTPDRIGLLLTMTLLGDVAISLWITTTADRIGRKRMLIVGAILMALAGAVFLSTDDFYLLLAAATIGVVSPSGNEVGPFLAIEQAALAQVVTAEQRTRVFAWYNLAGSLATAFGCAAVRPARPAPAGPGTAPIDELPDCSLALRRRRRLAGGAVPVAATNGGSAWGWRPFRKPLASVFGGEGRGGKSA